MIRIYINLPQDLIFFNVLDLNSKIVDSYNQYEKRVVFNVFNVNTTLFIFLYEVVPTFLDFDASEFQLKKVIQLEPLYLILMT